MPLKFTKDVSTQLFKYVRTIDITFNPFDGRTRSAREMMRQCQAERYVKANPKLKLNINIAHTAAPPAIVFTFVDGKVLDFDSQKFICNEMMFKVLLKASEIDVDYEMNGRNIDDE